VDVAAISFHPFNLIAAVGQRRRLRTERHGSCCVAMRLAGHTTGRLDAQGLPTEVDPPSAGLAVTTMLYIDAHRERMCVFNAEPVDFTNVDVDLSDQVTQQVVSPDFVRPLIADFMFEGHTPETGSNQR
jgi:hypothetical protein